MPDAMQINARDRRLHIMKTCEKCASPQKWNRHKREGQANHLSCPECMIWLKSKLREGRQMKLDLESDLRMCDCSTFDADGNVGESLWELTLYRTTKSQIQDLRKYLLNCIEKAEKYDKILERRKKHLVQRQGADNMKLIHKKCGSTLRTMVYYAYEDGSTRNKHCKDWTWCEKCARPRRRDI